MTDVLTDAAFGAMVDLAARYTAGVERIIDTNNLEWSISQLGARAEYRFASPAPRTGTASHRAADPLLEDYLHLYLANRGILLTPFHNMALICPTTTAADVDVHLDVLAAAVGSLFA